MRVRITGQPDVRLVGHSAQVPLVHEGVNPHIRDHVAVIPMHEHLRLKELSSGTPGGLLQISLEREPATAEGTELTYMHGVAIDPDAAVPDGLEVIAAPAGSWAVFTTQGPHPQALQQTWAATAAEWFPSNPWRLRPGPSIVAVLDHDEGFTSATCELWLPVEHA